MTMIINSSNGKIRKNLSDQIDRLDRVLDGLGDGLNEAIAEAVKVAVGQAVQVVLTEVLSNPEILAKLSGALPASRATALRPSLRERLGRLWQQIRNCIERLRRLCHSKLQ